MAQSQEMPGSDLAGAKTLPDVSPDRGEDQQRAEAAEQARREAAARQGEQARQDLESALKQVEQAMRAGIEDGSIRDCDVRMTGNAIMGALNWIPKWFHGDTLTAEKLVEEFPKILADGLAERPGQS